MKNTIAIARMALLLTLSSCAPSQTSQKSSCQMTQTTPLFSELHFGCSPESAKLILEHSGFRRINSKIYSNNYQTDLFSGKIDSDWVVVMINFSPVKNLESIAVSPELAPLKDSDIRSKFKEINDELSLKYGIGKAKFSEYAFAAQKDDFYTENLEALRGKIWIIKEGEISLSFIKTPTQVSYPNNHNLSWFISYEAVNYDPQKYRDARF